MIRALVLAAVLLGLPPAAAGEGGRAPDAAAADRAIGLAAQLRCLVCQNQSIAESNAELAVDLRRQIDEQIAAGRTDREILEFMTARYGDFVLYRPPFKASTALLWLGPALLLAIGAGVLVRTLRSRAAAGDERPLTEEERERAAALLTGGGGREPR